MPPVALTLWLWFLPADWMLFDLGLLVLEVLKAYCFDIPAVVVGLDFIAMFGSL